MNQFHQNRVTSTLCERRQFQRLTIAVQAELRAQGNEVPIRVETTDISLGGCYVEMALTLCVGTLLNIVLWLGQEKLVVDGRVVTHHPQFGNGIAFTGLSHDSQQKLQRFLENSPSKDQQPVSPLGRLRL